MADYKTSLMMDVSQFVAPIGRAREANQALTGSVDNIIGALQRQHREMQKTAAGPRSTMDNIIAAGSRPGATEGSVNAAAEMHARNEAMRDRMTVQQLRTAGGAGRDQMENDAHLERQQRDESARMARADKIESDRIRKENERAGILGTLQGKVDGARRSEEEYTLAKLRGADASDRQIKQAQNLITKDHRQTAQQRTDDRNVSRQMDAQRAAQRGGDAIGGMSRNAMLATESMRGLEDAVAGFTNNGLKGMLQATTNNVGQIGALIGGTAGLSLGIGSIAAMAAVTIVPMFQKWASGMDDVIEKEKLLAAEAKRTTDAYLANISQRANASFGKQDADAVTRRMVQDRDSTPEQLAGERDRVKQRGLDARRQQKIERATQEEIGVQQTRIGRDINVEKMIGGDPARVKDLEKESRDLEAKRKESAERMRIAKADEANASRQQDELENAEAIAQSRQMAKEKITEEEREQKEWAALRKERAERDKQVKDGAGGVLRDLLKDQDPGRLETMDRQQRAEEQRKKLETARDQGLISGAEFDQVNQSLGKAPSKNRDNAPDDGRTGFQSADVKSTSGFNAMMQAIRAGQQKESNDPAIIAAKQDADMLADILRRIEAKPAGGTVVNF